MREFHIARSTTKLQVLIHILCVPLYVMWIAYQVVTDFCHTGAAGEVVGVGRTSSCRTYVLTFQFPEYLQTNSQARVYKMRTRHSQNCRLKCVW
jgi:hypothetical protein